MREYTQLSEDERYTIYGEKHKGKTNVEIAKILNRHPATIGRELKRNKGLTGLAPIRRIKKVRKEDTANRLKSPNLARRLWCI